MFDAKLPQAGQSTLRMDFVWKPDQCPGCAYELCGHIGGTKGVSDAMLRCSRCATTFSYGSIESQRGPIFVRTELGTGTTSLMPWSRSWNRLVGSYDDERVLLKAILAGQEVRTPWASYILRVFHPKFHPK